MRLHLLLLLIWALKRKGSPIFQAWYLWASKSKAQVQLRDICIFYRAAKQFNVMISRFILTSVYIFLLWVKVFILVLRCHKWSQTYYKFDILIMIIIIFVKFFIYISKCDSFPAFCHINPIFSYDEWNWVHISSIELYFAINHVQSNTKYKYKWLSLWLVSQNKYH